MPFTPSICCPAPLLPLSRPPAGLMIEGEGRQLTGGCWEAQQDTAHRLPSPCPDAVHTLRPLFVRCPAHPLPELCTLLHPAPRALYLALSPSLPSPPPVRCAVAERMNERMGRALKRLSHELYSKDAFFVLKLVQARGCGGGVRAAGQDVAVASTSQPGGARPRRLR